VNKQLLNSTKNVPFLIINKLGQELTTVINPILIQAKNKSIFFTVQFWLIKRFNLKRNSA
jgi:hypothetical protein